MFCHDVVDVSKKESGEYRVWAMLLQGMWVLPLFRKGEGENRRREPKRGEGKKFKRVNSSFHFSLVGFFVWWKLLSANAVGSSF